MGEKFDTEIKKAEKLSKYNMYKASKLLDDLGTAYISTEFNCLDNSLIAVKTAKKAMRAQGIPQHIIDEYFIERSYLSKTQLRSFVNDSIYTEDDSMKTKLVVELIPAFHTDKTTTDIIIDELKSRPVLLSALQRGVSAQFITQKLNVPNAIALKNFYKKNKSIIDD